MAEVFDAIPDNHWARYAALPPGTLGVMCFVGNRTVHETFENWTQINEQHADVPLGVVTLHSCWRDQSKWFYHNEYGYSANLSSFAAVRAPGGALVIMPWVEQELADRVVEFFRTATGEETEVVALYDVQEKYEFDGGFFQEVAQVDEDYSPQTGDVIIPKNASVPRIVNITGDIIRLPGPEKVSFVGKISTLSIAAGEQSANTNFGRFVGRVPITQFKHTPPTNIVPGDTICVNNVWTVVTAGFQRGDRYYFSLHHKAGAHSYVRFYHDSNISMLVCEPAELPDLWEGFTTNDEQMATYWYNLVSEEGKTVLESAGITNIVNYDNGAELPIENSLVFFGNTLPHPQRNQVEITTVRPDYRRYLQFRGNYPENFRVASVATSLLYDGLKYAEYDVEHNNIYVSVNPYTTPDRTIWEELAKLVDVDRTNIDELVLQSKRKLLVQDIFKTTEELDWDNLTGTILVGSAAYKFSPNPKEDNKSPTITFTNTDGTSITVSLAEQVDEFPTTLTKTIDNIISSGLTKKSVYREWLLSKVEEEAESFCSPVVDATNKFYEIADQLNRRSRQLISTYNQMQQMTDNVNTYNNTLVEALKVSASVVESVLPSSEWRVRITPAGYIEVCLDEKRWSPQEGPKKLKKATFVNPVNIRIRLYQEDNGSWTIYQYNQSVHTQASDRHDTIPHDWYSTGQLNQRFERPVLGRPTGFCMGTGEVPLPRHTNFVEFLNRLSDYLTRIDNILTAPLYSHSRRYGSLNIGVYVCLKDHESSLSLAEIVETVAWGQTSLTSLGEMIENHGSKTCFELFHEDALLEVFGEEFVEQLKTKCPTKEDFLEVVQLAEDGGANVERTRAVLE